MFYYKMAQCRGNFYKLVMIKFLNENQVSYIL